MRGKAANLKDGLRLFESSCASCHQWNSDGPQSPYAALLGARSVNDPSGRNVVQMILTGTRAHIAGTEVFMPSFRAALTDDEIAQLSNYVLYQFGGKRGKVTAAGVAKQRQE